MASHSPAPFEARDTDSLETLCAIISADTERAQPLSPNWAPIVELALANDLAPMLHHQLDRFGWWKEVDLESRTAVEREARSSALRSALFEREQERIAQEIRRASIPVLWLKGLLLAHRLYPQPYCRPMVDIDMLIPEDQRDAVASLMLQSGYRLDPDDDLQLLAGHPAIASKISHHDVYYRDFGVGCRVEVHYRLGSLRGIPQVLDPTDWIWTQAVRDGDGQWVLKTEALLLYLIAHIALQHGDR